MCCQPKTPHNVANNRPLVEEDPDDVQIGDELVVVQPTQEELDELEDRDLEIAEEGEPE